MSVQSRLKTVQREVEEAKTHFLSNAHFANPEQVKKYVSNLLKDHIDKAILGSLGFQHDSWQREWQFRPHGGGTLVQQMVKLVNEDAEKVIEALKIQPPTLTTKQLKEVVDYYNSCYLYALKEVAKVAAARHVAKYSEEMVDAILEPPSLDKKEEGEEEE